MNEFPLVSVALCTYNGENFIRQQLDSLLNQTYSNIEIVAVDDCSTDNTFKLLQDYKIKFPQIKLYRNSENLGFIKNFEKALNLCQGDFLAFSDQDDVWEKGKIKQQVDNLGENVLIYHDSLFIDSEGKSLDIKISDIKNMYEGKDPRAFLFNNCVSGHSILMNRKLLIDILPFPKDVFYDWWIAFVALNNGSIKYLPKTLVYYRKHGDSITSENLTFDNKRNKGILSLEQQIIEFCLKGTGSKYRNFYKNFKFLMERQKHSKPNLQLVLLMLSNLNVLFYIKKKGFLSKVNLISKNLFSRGLRV